MRDQKMMRAGMRNKEFIHLALVSASFYVFDEQNPQNHTHTNRQPRVHIPLNSGRSNSLHPLDPSFKQQHTLTEIKRVMHSPD